MGRDHGPGVRRKEFKNRPQKNFKSYSKSVNVKSKRRMKPGAPMAMINSKKRSKIKMPIKKLIDSDNPNIGKVKFKYESNRANTIERTSIDKNTVLNVVMEPKGSKAANAAINRLAMLKQTNYGYDNLPLYTKRKTNLIRKLQTYLSKNYMNEKIKNLKDYEHEPYKGFEISKNLNLTLSKNYFNKMKMIKISKEVLQNRYNRVSFHYLGKLTNETFGNCDVWYHTGHEPDDSVRGKLAEGYENYNYFGNFDVEREINASMVEPKPVFEATGFPMTEAVEMDDQKLDQSLDDSLDDSINTADVFESKNYKFIDGPTMASPFSTDLNDDDNFPGQTPLPPDNFFPTMSPFYRKDPDKFKKYYNPEKLRCDNFSKFRKNLVEKNFATTKGYNNILDIFSNLPRLTSNTSHINLLKDLLKEDCDKAKERFRKLKNWRPMQLVTRHYKYYIGYQIADVNNLTIGFDFFRNMTRIQITSRMAYLNYLNREREHHKIIDMVSYAEKKRAKEKAAAAREKDKNNKIKAKSESDKTTSRQKRYEDMGDPDDFANQQVEVDLSNLNKNDLLEIEKNGKKDKTKEYNLRGAPTMNKNGEIAPIEETIILQSYLPSRLRYLGAINKNCDVWWSYRKLEQLLRCNNTLDYKKLDVKFNKLNGTQTYKEYSWNLWKQEQIERNKSQKMKIDELHSHSEIRRHIVFLPTAVGLVIVVLFTYFTVRLLIKTCQKFICTKFNYSKSNKNNKKKYKYEVAQLNEMYDNDPTFEADMVGSPGKTGFTPVLKKTRSGISDDRKHLGQGQEDEQNSLNSSKISYSVNLDDVKKRNKDVIETG